MGHEAVGQRWERVAIDLLDMSITSAKGNRYVLVMPFRWRLLSSVTLYANLGCLV